MAVVRRLGAGDIDGFRAMNALFAEVFGEPETYTSNRPGDAYAAALLERTDTILLVAEEEGRTLGALAGYFLPKFEQERGEIYIYDLAVAEPARRRGVATELIGQARRIARDCGAWTVFVQADTAPEDEPARRLYRKLASEEITARHFDIAP